MEKYSINDIIVEKFGDVTVKHDTVLNYKYSFNTKTGLAIRTNVMDDNGNYTQEEVFAARFPHLIDVGIMGHCSHGKSGLCLKSGVQCYQNGLNVFEENMSLTDFTRIVSECKGLVNQIALGGRGDPNEHENFKEILKICRDNDIIPNYTTSGFNLTDNQIKDSKEYCGAVAVSWYRNEYTENAIKRLIKAEVKTNIHYVLNLDTIDEAIWRLEKSSFPKGINAVVFLTHKPVGLGEKEKCLTVDDKRVNYLSSLIKKGEYPYKIGIDGCFVVGLINSNLNFNMNYLDTCEATRFTCYINSKLLMSPCSFDIEPSHMIDLKSVSILEAWNSDAFNQIRYILKNSCPGCDKQKNCMGGCFLYPEIVLCQNK